MNNGCINFSRVYLVGVEEHQNQGARKGLKHDKEDPQMLDGGHFRVQYCKLKPLRDLQGRREA